MTLADALVATGVHVEDDRRRDRHLRHARRARLEEFEGADDRALPPADRSRDPQSGGCLTDAVLISPGHFRGSAAIRGNALPIHDQLEPPTAPAEFAVGHRSQSHALLHRNDVANAFATSMRCRSAW